MKSYKLAEPTVRRLYDSRLRLAILDALKDGPLRLADLRRKVDANAPNTSSKAKDLEEMGLVEREGGDYCLSTCGRIVQNKAASSLSFYAAYGKFKDFWNERRLEAIPDEFLARLGDLKNSQLLTCTRTNANAPFELLFKAITSTTDHFYGLAPIYHRMWSELPKHLISKKIDTRLILTEPVFREKVRVLSKEGIIPDFDKNATFFEIGSNEPWPGFMMAENFFGICFESKSAPNMYLDKLLYSTDPRAIKWGLDLFEHYKTRSRPVRLCDYL